MIAEEYVSRDVDLDFGEEDFEIQSSSDYLHLGRVGIPSQTNFKFISLTGNLRQYGD